ncbi:subtilisin-like protein [Lactarius indigo]|nr:subtilisin-like protein [Lactarius indigo]
MRYYCIPVLYVLAAVPLGSLAKPLEPLVRWGPMHIKHSWSAVPDDWQTMGHPPSGTTINLYIALKSHHQNALKDTLYQVSEPTHPRYGAHLTNEQLAKLIAPHPETLELVSSWLVHQGIPTSSISMTHGGDTITLKDIPIMQANALLNASYQLYRHVEHGGTIVRTVGYALPVGLHRHVVTVAPTTSFFSPPLPTQWHAPLNGTDGEVVGQVRTTSGEHVKTVSKRAKKVGALKPSFLRWLYGTEACKPAAIDRNSLGIVGFLNDFPSPTDLKASMRKNRSDGKHATITVTPVNNGEYNPKRPADEANLDVQYAVAMVYPTPVTFYSTGRGASNTDDWFISFLGYILKLGMRARPKTISTSYCVNEKSSSLEYSIYVCDLFGKLGLLGVSVLYATCGDGVGKECVLSDGSLRFKPKFPATCPYFTAVGGTTDYEPEGGAFLSGGGFSDYFETPDFQRQVVPRFFGTLGNKYQGLYNASGRGIPDISAQAIGFEIILSSKRKTVHGTRGSAPVVAGIIALLDDYLISNNRPVLGFLNPWLYGRPAGSIFDVTTGTNPGCGTDGFSAVPGWGSCELLHQTRFDVTF